MGKLRILGTSQYRTAPVEVMDSDSESRTSKGSSKCSTTCIAVMMSKALVGSSDLARSIVDIPSAAAIARPRGSRSAIVEWKSWSWRRPYDMKPLYPPKSRCLTAWSDA